MSNLSQKTCHTSSTDILTHFWRIDVQICIQLFKGITFVHGTKKARAESWPCSSKVLDDARVDWGTNQQHEIQGHVRHYEPQIKMIGAEWYLLAEVSEVQAGAGKRCLNVDSLV